MTPQRYIAFLRAINVGGHVVKMTALAAIFKQLGLADVATFIASGNVIFRSGVTDTATLERRISNGLERALGYPVGTFIRTTSEVAAIAESEPFPRKAMEGATLYVGFLSAPPSNAAARQVAAFKTDTDDFRVVGRELLWLCRTGMMDSRFNYAMLEKTVTMQATFRNVNTIRRLAAKFPPA